MVLWKQKSKIGSSKQKWKMSLFQIHIRFNYRFIHRKAWELVDYPKNSWKIQVLWMKRGRKENNTSPDLQIGKHGGKNIHLHIIIYSAMDNIYPFDEMGFSS